MNCCQNHNFEKVAIDVFPLFKCCDVLTRLLNESESFFSMFVNVLVVISTANIIGAFQM